MQDDQRFLAYTVSVSRRDWEFKLVVYYVFYRQMPYSLAFRNAVRGLTFQICANFYNLCPESTPASCSHSANAKKEKSMAVLEVSKPIQERFRELKEDWKSKTRHLSNTAQISLVFPYQMIIGMGPQVIPLILSELEKDPDHWFWALEAITGENPVAKNEAGDMEASAEAWIRWGKQNGLLPK